MQTQSFTVRDDMPAWVDARNAHLNRAARECYELRNTAEGDQAGFYEEIGDVFLYRAMALTEEWEDTPILVGCGYCMDCGYGGEPSDSCLHKRPAA